jgi:hypothetical protein
MPKLETVVVNGQLTVAVQLTNRELSNALWQIIDRICVVQDDAGCEWATDDLDGTWIMYSDPQCISTEPNVAALVDAANYLGLGRILDKD